MRSTYKSTVRKADREHRTLRRPGRKGDESRSAFGAARDARHGGSDMSSVRATLESLVANRYAARPRRAFFGSEAATHSFFARSWRGARVVVGGSD
jgi:hypothetical protein